MVRSSRSRWSEIRRVEHLALAVAVWGVDAVKNCGVKVWIEPEATVGALETVTAPDSPGRPRSTCPRARGPGGAAMKGFSHRKYPHRKSYALVQPLLRLSRLKHHRFISVDPLVSDQASMSLQASQMHVCCSAHPPFYNTPKT